MNVTAFSSQQIKATEKESSLMKDAEKSKLEKDLAIHKD